MASTQKIDKGMQKRVIHQNFTISTRNATTSSMEDDYNGIETMDNQNYANQRARHDNKQVSNNSTSHLSHMVDHPSDGQRFNEMLKNNDTGNMIQTNSDVE